MKIALECQDIIIERTLQLFLRPFLVMKKDCDFIVCDGKISSNKPQFIINNHSTQLAIPFSKEQLLEALGEFDRALQEFAQKIAEQKKKELESKINTLAAEFRKSYQNDIDSAVSALKERLFKVLNNE